MDDRLIKPKKMPAVESEPKTPTSTSTSSAENGENGESIQDVKEMENIIKNLEKYGKITTTRDNEHWRKILEEDDEVSSNIYVMI